MEGASNTNGDIFADISDYVTHITFQNAQSEYLLKHMVKFEDTEENKLEYTTVHEGYVFILESIIDAKLQEKYSETQISDFYEGFLNDFPTYQSQNPEVVETLMDFVDYGKFKATMLDFKSVNKVDTAANALAIQVGLEFTPEQFYKLKEEDINDKSLGWSKKGTVDDEDMSYVCYGRQMKSGLNLWKYDITWKDCNLKTMNEFMKTAEEFMGQQKDVEVYKYVEKNSEGLPTVIYQKNKATIGSQRDMLIKYEYFEISPTSSMIILSPTTHADYPVDEKIIRMDIFDFNFQEEIGGDIHSIKFQSFDIKGWFPVRMLNMVMGAFMGQMMKNVAKQFKQIKANMV